jgi:hypothetical protein
MVCFQTPVAAEDAPPEDGNLRVMTYNLRYAGLKPPNAWFQRRPAARAMLDHENPDVIGMQEALYPGLFIASCVVRKRVLAVV